MHRPAGSMLENSLKRFYLDSSLTASREVDTSTLLIGLLRFFVSVEGGGAAWSGALMQGVLMPVILVSSLTMSDSSWAANSGFGREAGGVSIKNNRRSHDLISFFIGSCTPQFVVANFAQRLHQQCPSNQFSLLSFS